MESLPKYWVSLRSKTEWEIDSILPDGSILIRKQNDRGWRQDSRIVSERTLKRYYFAVNLLEKFELEETYA